MLLRFIFVSILLLFSTEVFGQIDYQDSIQPIFNSNCTSCHGGLRGVTLDSI